MLWPDPYGECHGDQHSHLSIVHRIQHLDDRGPPSPKALVNYTDSTFISESSCICGLIVTPCMNKDSSKICGTKGLYRIIYGNQKEVEQNRKPNELKRVTLVRR